MGIYYVIIIISDVCLLLVFELLLIYMYCVADVDDYETGRKIIGQLYICFRKLMDIEHTLCYVIMHVHICQPNITMNHEFSIPYN